MNIQCKCSDEKKKENSMHTEYVNMCVSSAHYRVQITYCSSITRMLPKKNNNNCVMREKIGSDNNYTLSH